MTGSKASCVNDYLKGGKESAARRDYRLQLVCESLTGKPQEDGDGFVSAAMLRGIELEPLAFAAYEALTGSVAVRTGFLSHDTIMAGCSLDGHVDNYAGILEIKCPKSATHLGYWRGGIAPADHLPQMIHNMWISGAGWCDFLSFDDRFPPELQSFLVRVTRADVDMDGYEAAALKFLGEVTADTDTLRTQSKGLTR